jgi:NAD+ synthase (glutamine-hydrolysing)
VKVALCSIDVTVGDLAGNAELIKAGISRARDAGAELAVFPELCITGYPPVDLLLNRDFIRDCRERLNEIARDCTGIAAVVGGIEQLDGTRAQRNRYDLSMVAHHPGTLLNNTAFLLAEGQIAGRQAKTFLPNYDVFDETRYFCPAERRGVFELKGAKFGVNVCEDIWIDHGPTEEQAKLGAEFIINISASPFYLGKWQLRKQLICKRAKDSSVPVLYVNSVGGQDSLVFDGGCFAYDGRGDLCALGRHFQSETIVVDTANPALVQDKTPNEAEETYQALVLGLKDYVNKNAFKKVLLGLSGGVDSALVVALAAAALGPERVVAVAMPGPYSSKGSVTDAEKLCRNLYVELKTVNINAVYKSYLGTLKPEFRGKPEDVTEQNIQARVRGNVLMALSNKFGYLVLSTGNKSEVSVGYNTLYGDMAGGLSVISDVPKTLVYKVCRHINDQVGRDMIPQSIMDKAPSAELKPNQTDQDDLPPYDVLDAILHSYIEENKTVEEIVEAGYDLALVKDIIRRVDRNEYKRQQAPLGLKITPKAFGFGRRMPVTNKYQ